MKTAPISVEFKVDFTYTYEGQIFQAQITRIENGVIYARTLQPNGDWTEEHTLPASEIKEQVFGYTAKNKC